MSIHLGEGYVEFLCHRLLPLPFQAQGIEIRDQATSPIFAQKFGQFHFRGAHQKMEGDIFLRQVLFDFRQSLDHEGVLAEGGAQELGHQAENHRQGFFLLQGLFLGKQ